MVGDPGARIKSAEQGVLPPDRRLSEAPMQTQAFLLWERILRGGF
jgi:hypothetical protein